MFAAHELTERDWGSEGGGVHGHAGSRMHCKAYAQNTSSQTTAADVNTALCNTYTTLHGSRVVSVLDSGTEGPGFKSQ